MALPQPNRAGRSVLVRSWNYLSDSRKIARTILNFADENNCDYVMLDSIREYLSPLWSRPLTRLKKMGIPLGVVAHDPVRDFVVGPKWWHDYSIRCAYASVTDVYVHDDRRIDFGGKRPENIKVYKLPHGPFIYPKPAVGRSAIRKELKLEDDDHMLLSFGQIRDGKQLDLVLDAMRDLPESLKLVIAGKGGAKSQKPSSYYKELAERYGLAHRCRWLERYMDDNEVSDLFVAADSILMTYSRKFVSASGVMNTAVSYGRPVLASGGDGPLKLAVTQYPIGVWVEPGSREEMLGGLKQLMGNADKYQFHEYIRDHSWKANALTVRDAILRSKNSSSF